MKVRELIDVLSKFPDSADVQIFHDRYCGGGDSERFDDPAVFISDDLSLVYITPEGYEDYLTGVIRPYGVLTVEKLEDAIK